MHGAITLTSNEHSVIAYLGIASYFHGFPRRTRGKRPGMPSWGQKSRDREATEMRSPPLGPLGFVKGFPINCANFFFCFAVVGCGGGIGVRFRQNIIKKQRQKMRK